MKAKFTVENGLPGTDNVQIKVEGINIPEGEQIYLKDQTKPNSAPKPVIVYKEEGKLICEADVSFKESLLYPCISISCKREDTEKLDEITIVNKCKLKEVMLMSTSNADKSIKSIRSSKCGNLTT